MTLRHLGTWRLIRSIVDASATTTLACDGYATLTRDGSRLQYDETVTVHVPQRTLHATRRYVYLPATYAIAALFADGRPFFIAPLRPDGTATAEHDCGDDTYSGTFSLANEHAWRTVWDIRGTKAVRISTAYTRR